MTQTFKYLLLTLVLLVKVGNHNPVYSQEQENLINGNLAINIGYNQMRRGYIFSELEIWKRRKSLAWSGYDFSAAIGYNPWFKSFSGELKSHINFFAIFSLGASIGYYMYNNPSYNTPIFKPQIGFDLYLFSIYYGYNLPFRSNANPYFYKYNITLTLFLFGLNQSKDNKSREFKWWGNMFK